jgi:hypothetical protein
MNPYVGGQHAAWANALGGLGQWAGGLENLGLSALIGGT